MLCDELSEYAGKQEMGTGELDVIHKLTASIKNIDKIAMFESGGYSRDDGYSREDGYSRDDVYSRESRGKEAIERMMQDTDDPTVKEALRQAVHVMENA